jgi:hypothetical protein
VVAIVIADASPLIALGVIHAVLDRCGESVKGCRHQAHILGGLVA